MSTTPLRETLLQRLLIGVFLSFLFVSLVQAQTVQPWLTKGDQSKLLDAQTPVSFQNSSSNAFATLTLDPGQTFQSIEGLGFMLTQGSAQVIRTLSPSEQTTLLNELFHPSTGLGISMVRISIGASDLSNSTYTYNETPGDVNMNNFSLVGPDETDLIPVLQLIRGINPNVKILATPWTAPTWMKTNGGFQGGSLAPAYYGAYANYFVKYLQEMAVRNLPIWGITPQNEPENGFNTPSMVMTANEQVNFINNHLGPSIANAGLSPKIIAFDHNCDNPNYPITVLNNSSYVVGAAFHLYGGDISALSQVRNATNKDVYFTEQYTDVNGNFNGDFGWHMKNVVIGSLNNYARTVLEWNLATDENYGPFTPGGCTECLGALTISSNQSINRNVSYYIIGQLAKFTKAGAQRFSVSSSRNEVHATALQNPDGSKVLLVYNDRNRNATLKVVEGTQSFNFTVPKKSAVTFTWTDGGTGNTQPFPGAYNILARHSGKGLDVAGNSTSSGANVEQYEINNGGGDNQRWRIEEAGSGNFYLKVKHTNMCLSAATNQKADGVNVVQKTCSGAANQKWQINDLNNGYYSIQNQHNGRVLDVASASTNNSANVQVWTNFSSNNQQWELVQVEGNTTRLAAAPLMEASPLHLFPNPTTRQTTLAFSPETQIVSLQLVDVLGRTHTAPIVAKKEGQLTLSLEHLTRGLYFLRISLPEKTIVKSIQKN